jgi:hypothetical protein
LYFLNLRDLRNPHLIHIIHDLPLFNPGSPEKALSGIRSGIFLSILIWKVTFDTSCEHCGLAVGCSLIPRDCLGPESLCPSGEPAWRWTSAP